MIDYKQFRPGTVILDSGGFAWQSAGETTSDVWGMAVVELGKPIDQFVLTSSIFVCTDRLVQDFGPLTVLYEPNAEQA